jgi:hypothetical protein
MFPDRRTGPHVFIWAQQPDRMSFNGSARENTISNLRNKQAAVDQIMILQINENLVR